MTDATPAVPLSLPEREPLTVLALIVGAVSAVIDVVVAFGVSLAPAAEHSILAAVNAIGLLAIVLLVRPRTVPAAKVIARVTTGGDVVAGEASTIPTNTLVDVARTGVLAPVNPDLVTDPG